jgi:hypothetical protein
LRGAAGHLLGQQVHELGRFSHLHYQYGVGLQGGGEGVAAGVAWEGCSHHNNIWVHKPRRAESRVALRGNGYHFAAGIAQALLPETGLLRGVGGEQDAKEKRRHCSRKTGFSFKENEAKLPALATAMNPDKCQTNGPYYSLCGFILGLLILGVAVTV